MNIETKLNVGDTAYTFHNDCFLKVEVLKIHIFVQDERAVNYQVEDLTGKFELDFCVPEERIFKHKSYLSAYITRILDAL